MKHLPNELLYLLKVYNYVVYDIGLDRARSRAEDIRNYIANADFLHGHPTVLEYLSEEKSIEDIITYIQRNEKTYSLLGEWAARETEALFKEKNIEPSTLGITGGFSIKRDNCNAYFILPYKEGIDRRIVLLDADLTDDIYIEKVLWLEFYRKRDGMCFELFDDNCRTTKICFSDFEWQKVFLSAEILSKNCKSDFESAVKMSSFILEKYEYGKTLLNKKEAELLPVTKILARPENIHGSGSYEFLDACFKEHSISKGERIIASIKNSDSEKKIINASKKLMRLLRSNKCIPLMQDICKQITDSQKPSRISNEG